MKYRLLLLVGLVSAGVAIPFAMFGRDPQEDDRSAERDDKDEKKDAADKDKSEDKDKKEQGTAGSSKPEQVAKAESKQEVKKEAEAKAQPKEEPKYEFAVPGDAGGRLVLRILAPATNPPARPNRDPRPKPAPKAIEQPGLPLPREIASLPRYPDAGKWPPFYPQLSSGEPLFGLEESFGAFPQSKSYSPADRARYPSIDVALPVELPRMALPVVEKANLSDPSLDHCKTSILAAPLPVREAPSPFLRLVIPDPAEHVEAVKLPATPGPDELPIGTVRTPR